MDYTFVTPLSPIDQMLVGMLRAYPSLRSTRAEALFHALDYSGNEWGEDGHLIVSPEQTTRTADYRNETLEREEKHLRETPEGKRKTAESSYAGDVLRLKKSSNAEAFIADNAELIVRADTSWGTFKQNTPSRMSLLDKLPDNLAPEWRDEIISLLEEIIRFNPGNRFAEYSEDFQKTRLADIERAKDSARKTLILLKGSDEEKKAVHMAQIQKKIDAIAADAQRLGVTVTASVS